MNYILPFFLFICLLISLSSQSVHQGIPVRNLATKSTAEPTTIGPLAPLNIEEAVHKFNKLSGDRRTNQKLVPQAAQKQTGPISAQQTRISKSEVSYLEQESTSGSRFHNSPRRIEIQERTAQSLASQTETGQKDRALVPQNTKQETGVPNLVGRPVQEQHVLTLAPQSTQKPAFQNLDLGPYAKNVSETKTVQESVPRKTTVKHLAPKPVTKKTPAKHLRQKSTTRKGKPLSKKFVTRKPSAKKLRRKSVTTAKKLRRKSVTTARYTGLPTIKLDREPYMHTDIPPLSFGVTHFWDNPITDPVCSEYKCRTICQRKLKCERTFCELDGACRCWECELPFSLSPDTGVTRGWYTQKFTQFL